MKTKIISALLFLIIIIGIAAPVQSSIAENTWQPETTIMGDEEQSILSSASDLVGSVFTENRGQVDNDAVLFYAASGSVAFTSNSVFLYSSVQSDINQQPDKQDRNSLDIKQNSLRNVIQLSFPASNNVVPVGIDPVAWNSNYLRGSDTTLWQTNISNYQMVMYENLWDGIDLAYHIENRALKYDFIVHPYADHSEIKIMVNGQKSLSISDNTELIIGLEDGSVISDSKLDVFYENNEKVEASFVLVDDDTYSFDIIGRDFSRTLIIDPLIYSTFLGGSDNDFGVDVAVGNDGCAYVTGNTNSINFPATFGAIETVYNGYDYDIFVAKMGLNGNTFVYCTYIGATAGDFSKAIAVDYGGCAYITGYTMSSEYPTTSRAYDTIYNGGAFDAFVTKLSPFGTSLVYSTFLGGPRTDIGNDLAVDKNGFVYVTGEAWLTPPPGPLDSGAEYFSFPTTPGAFRWSNGLADIFVTKLDQLGEKLVYSSAFGTDDYDYSNSIAVDGSGYVYLTGQTRSASFPLSTNAYDRSTNGGYDAFAMKLSLTGATLVFSTFLGGDSSDSGLGIAVGEWGHVYVTGYTNSANFPITEGAFDTTHNGGTDAFVTMLGKYGESLGFSTFIGGSGNDYCNGIALDSLGSAHVTGTTDSSDYPVTMNAFDDKFNGGIDAFITKLSASGTIQYSTFLGDTGNDFGRGIDIGASNFLYVTGETYSTGFSITTGAQDITYNGNSDAFVTKLDIADPIADAGVNQRIHEAHIATFDGRTSSDNDEIVNYTWTFNYDSANITLYGILPQYKFFIPGIYAIMLNVSDASGNWAIDTMALTVVDITRPVAIAGLDQIVNEGTEVFFNGSASTDNVGIVNYTWIFTEGAKSVNLYGVYSSYFFTIPGIHTVTLKATDEIGNAGTDTLQVKVIDTTSPIANAGPNQRVYKGTSVRFNGAASTDNVAVVNYTWMFNDGLSNVILYGLAPIHFFNVPGIFTVMLKVADSMGYTHSDEMLLTILEIIKPVAVAGPDLVTNEREQTWFDGSGSTDNIGVAYWAWTFNDGLNDVSIFGASPTWKFMISGVYIVTLNTSDAAGNWDTDTFTVTVLDTTSPTVITGPNQIVIEGTVVTFNALGSSDRSGIASYTWNFTYNGTLVTLDGANPSFQFWTVGSYQVILTVQDAAGNYASEILTITVQPLTIQESVGWVDDDGWILMPISGVLILVAVGLLVYRRKKVISP